MAEELLHRHCELGRVLNSTIEFAAAYVPSHSVSGSERLGPPFPSPTPGSNINVSMHQYQVVLSWTYQFGGPPASALIHK